MYDAFIDFLITLSQSNPVLWGIFVVAVIGGLGLVLYGLWEIVLRLTERSK